VGSLREIHARKEAAIYARQLKREFPKGSFAVKSFNHDFGVYHEVVATYVDARILTELENSEREAAFDAEGDSHPKWDEEALKDLHDEFDDWYFKEIRVKG